MSGVPARDLDADIAIVGSGFAGAVTAMALRRLDRSVVLLERGRHPRFAIGESSTPMANLLIEELADRYDLPRIRPLSKFGTWRRAYPDVACGLKRGFSFYRHDPGRAFADNDAHDRQLLVAASPHDDIADTHWYRPDFDHFLVREAIAGGAVYLDDITVNRIHTDAAGTQIDATRHGQSVGVTARFLIDASGPRGCLHRALTLEESTPRWLPPTQGLYAHFSGVKRWADLIQSDAEPPFPVDDAAVHHVFPGGWIWILRFGNGLTSAGAAVTDQLGRELGCADGEPAWHRLLERLPSVRAQFAAARVVAPFVHAPRIAFRSARITGPGWALLPSAAGVIDPLLSTGFPLTLLGIHRLVDVLDRTWESPGRDAALAAYEAQTLRELDATERLVAALYASMADFTVFKRLSLLYFAAASFSEAARRLRRPALAPGFLLSEDPAFAPEMRACCEEAMQQPSGAARIALINRIDRAIAPIDVAGLGDRTRGDWYPVRAADLLAAQSKLASSHAEISELLERCGFGNTASAAGSDMPL